MFLLFPSLFLAFYSICSGVLPLKVSLAWKIALSVIILAIALKYQVYSIGGGTFFEPFVKGKALLIYEAFYGGLVVLTALLFFKDICSLALWLLNKWGVAAGISFNTNTTLAVLMAVSVVSGFWGMWEAIRVPDVRTVTLKVKGLPDAWKGTRIVQLSDLHIGPVQGAEWLSEVVKKTNALHPDMVLITGDFIDGSVPKTLFKLEPLKELKTKYGVYAIPGNHEYYSGYASWMKALSQLGLNMLQNQSAVLKKNEAVLIVGGTTDLGAARFGLEGPDLKKIFAGTPENATRILLTHQPRTTSGSSERVDLQLSGHTHGGHIFFMYPILAYFNDGMVSGAYQRSDKLVYVNRGTGLWNGFSIRIGVPSEITDITLE